MMHKKACKQFAEDKQTEGAFTPDVNEANKSRYSRVVGRLNILSLLAS